MPDTEVSTIEALDIHTVQLAHPPRQVGLRRFNEQMVVVAHLAPRVAHPIKTRANVAKYIQPDLSVGVRQIDVFAPIPPRGDVVEATGKLESQGT